MESVCDFGVPSGFASVRYDVSRRGRTLSVVMGVGMRSDDAICQAVMLSRSVACA